MTTRENRTQTRLTGNHFPESSVYGAHHTQIRAAVVDRALESLNNSTTISDASTERLSKRERFSLLRELRRSSEYSRLQRYLGRRGQSVSLKPRSSTVVRVETESGDTVDVAATAVDIRNGDHDSGVLVLARTANDGLVAAGIEYVETELQPVETSNGHVLTTTRLAEKPVARKAVDVLAGSEDGEITVTHEQAARQPAD